MHDSLSRMNCVSGYSFVKQQVKMRVAYVVYSHKTNERVREMWAVITDSSYVMSSRPPFIKSLGLNRFRRKKCKHCHWRQRHQFLDMTFRGMKDPSPRWRTPIVLDEMELCSWRQMFRLESALLVLKTKKGALEVVCENRSDVAAPIRCFLKPLFSWRPNSPFVKTMMTGTC